MRETDVINISAGGGGGYFALEVLQSMHGFEGAFINLAKLSLSGIVVITSSMALLARDSDGDGTPDFIDHARTICRAFSRRRRKPSSKCDAPPESPSTENGGGQA